MSIDNLRHAQYGSDGAQIDDPQNLTRMTDAQIQVLVSGVHLIVTLSELGGKLVAGETLIALSEVTPFINRTATGQAFTGACELAGYDCTVAAGNITIYDSLSAAGTVIVPTTALTLGRVEFVWKRALTLGCHVVLSGAATVNVLVG